MAEMTLASVMSAGVCGSGFFRELDEGFFSPACVRIWFTTSFCVLLMRLLLSSASLYSSSQRWLLGEPGAEAWRAALSSSVLFFSSSSCLLFSLAAWSSYSSSIRDIPFKSLPLLAKNLFSSASCLSSCSFFRFASASFLFWISSAYNLSVNCSLLKELPASLLGRFSASSSSRSFLSFAFSSCSIHCFRLSACPWRRSAVASCARSDGVEEDFGILLLRLSSTLLTCSRSWVACSSFNRISASKCCAYSLVHTSSAFSSRRWTPCWMRRRATSASSLCRSISSSYFRRLSMSSFFRACSAYSSSKRWPFALVFFAAARLGDPATQAVICTAKKTLQPCRASVACSSSDSACGSKCEDGTRRRPRGVRSPLWKIAKSSESPGAYPCITALWFHSGSVPCPAAGWVWILVRGFPCSWQAQ
mmetsp:Transcript_101287/g.286813  ORF Transcript_101287/g.286813 Transcript_101287/m.286813 type:complete len:419 (+) Transcript_101287:2188-3444(+)